MTKGDLHAFRNVGTTTGRLLAVHMPGGPRERFVEGAGELAIEAAASSSTEELLGAERLAALGTQHSVEIVPPPP